jgi:hypothetical protein
MTAVDYTGKPMRYAASLRVVGFLCLILAHCRCGLSQTHGSEQASQPQFLQQGAWKPHVVEQLNGRASRFKSAAGIQVITLPWEMGAVYYPYLVYMPERDRLLMLLLWGQETKAGMVSSDDRGATWTMPKEIGDGWATGLTYLDRGRAVLKRDHRYWFTDDYGANWDRSIVVPRCQDDKLFHEDSPFFADRDPQSGRVTRLWATGKKAGLACLVRTSDDGGATWSDARHIPEWGQTGEIVLHRADNSNLVAACRVNLPQFAGKIDHFSGLGVSVSTDNAHTWSELNILYAWGRHLSSMVTLENGDIVLTHIVRKGYVDTAEGLPQFGIEAVVSRDHGRTWDLDHRYLLAVWRGNGTGANASPQRTATILLPDGSLLTAFGTGFRNKGRQGKRTHSPQDIAVVRWRTGPLSLDDDHTIADAPFDSQLRNVIDPRISQYALSDPGFRQIAPASR